MKDFSVLVALQLQVNFILHTAAFPFLKIPCVKKSAFFA